MIVLHTPGLSGRSSSRVLLAIAAQQSRDTSGAMDTVAPRSSPQALPGSTKITKVWIQTPGPELSRRFDRVQRCAPLVPYDYWLFSSGFLVLVDPPELFC